MQGTEGQAWDCRAPLLRRMHLQMAPAQLALPSVQVMDNRELSAAGAQVTLAPIAKRGCYGP